MKYTLILGALLVSTTLPAHATSSKGNHSKNNGNQWNDCRSSYSNCGKTPSKNTPTTPVITLPPSTVDNSQSQGNTNSSDSNASSSGSNTNNNQSNANGTNTNNNQSGANANGTNTNTTANNAAANGTNTGTNTSNNKNDLANLNDVANNNDVSNLNDVANTNNIANGVDSTIGNKNANALDSDISNKNTNALDNDISNKNANANANALDSDISNKNANSLDNKNSADSASKSSNKTNVNSDVSNSNSNVGKNTSSNALSTSNSATTGSNKSSTNVDASDRSTTTYNSLAYVLPSMPSTAPTSLSNAAMQTQVMACSALVDIKREPVTGVYQGLVFKTHINQGHNDSVHTAYDENGNEQLFKIARVAGKEVLVGHQLHITTAVISLGGARQVGLGGGSVSRDYGQASYGSSSQTQRVVTNIQAVPCVIGELQSSATNIKQ